MTDLNEKLKAKIEEWRDMASRPRIRLSDSRMDVLVEQKTESVNDTLRLCADELESMTDKPNAAPVKPLAVTDPRIGMETASNAPVPQGRSAAVNTNLYEWLAANRVTLDGREMFAVTSFIVMNYLPIETPAPVEAGDRKGAAEEGKP